jgi:hypothetical protein
MPWAWHASMTAWRAADLDRRIALPPRPGDEPPGHERCRITIEAPGLHYMIEMRAPLDRHARSDQHTVVLDQRGLLSGIGSESGQCAVCMSGLYICAS